MAPYTALSKSEKEFYILEEKNRLKDIIIEEYKSKIESLLTEIVSQQSVIADQQYEIADQKYEIAFQQTEIAYHQTEIASLMSEKSIQYEEYQSKIKSLMAENSNYFDKYLEYSNKYLNQKPIYVKELPSEEFPYIMYGDDTVVLRFNIYYDDISLYDDDIKSYTLEHDCLEICPNIDEITKLVRHNIYCNSLTD